MKKIVEHTTRPDGEPITRTTLVDDKGNQVQTVESKDTPTLVSVRPAGWEHGIIKTWKGKQNEQE